MRVYIFLALLVTCSLLSCQKDPYNKDEIIDGIDLKTGAEELDKTSCFTIVYPLTFIMPDRSKITADNREELGAAIKTWYEANPNTVKRHFMQYPIEIIFRGKSKTIKNKKELERVKKACASDKERDKKKCIELVYPITYIMPDRSTLTGNNQKDLNFALKNWFREHPDFVRQKPILKYPVNIKFKGRPMTINNKKEMERVKKACND